MTCRLLSLSYRVYTLYAGLVNGDVCTAVSIACILRGWVGRQISSDVRRVVGALLALDCRRRAPVETGLGVENGLSSRHLASPATPPVTPAVKIPQGRAFGEGNRILLAHSFEPSCHRQRWPGGLEQKIILRALHTQRFNDRHPKKPSNRRERCAATSRSRNLPELISYSRWAGTR